MKSTPLTQGASTLILAVYLIHTLMTSPFVTILIAVAAGVIAFGFLESYELAVAFAIVAGVLYGLVAQTRFSYETKFVKENFSTTDTAQQISARVAEIKKEPRGVLASSYAEGFADATTDNSGNEVTANTSSSTTSGETKAAPAESSGGAGSGMTPPTPPEAATDVAKKASTGGQASATSGFTGSSKKNQQFQLGVIPDDSAGGFHIDQGTTVMNALKALNPDQVKSMTEDTRKLIETQKNLMSMLTTMKPMLTDGKQMMQNFQEMFGNGQPSLGK
jgi:hypothetical protein